MELSFGLNPIYLLMIFCQYCFQVLNIKAPISNRVLKEVVPVVVCGMVFTSSSMSIGSTQGKDVLHFMYGVPSKDSWKSSLPVQRFGISG